MPSVTASFIRATARVAGLAMTEGDAILSDGAVVHRVRAADSGLAPNMEYFALVDWIRATQDDEAELVAAYAATIEPEDLGVLGLAVKTAPTLRTSLELLARYFRLVTDGAAFRFDERGELAFLTVEEPNTPHPTQQFRNECALAAIARYIRYHISADIRFDSVSFRHNCRSTPGAYNALFDCDVRFAADRCGISIPQAILDAANRSSDPAVCAYLTQHLEQELGKLRSESPLGVELFGLLAEALDDGAPQANQIAAQMGMSERTLYRRLATEGLTYRDVLRQAQTTLAQKLLIDSDFSIAEIAFLTGFSEQSTFSRAFKRWVGQAPAQFRQQRTAS
ncbi:helix-turn-helix transcriptional regulator [Sulfitobacter mediterraneus]|jgi:AraC-like DNA-binding protein|uniref:helix-turn-helix transcriptional regulator n=1 Tax=Sulfitobacter mediterraneus TaxID=83219 RepID=UPI0021A2967E|nr:AraC family transcriptional regulator [Sulfitobacter mediterraneus]UWR12465.1 AraC family transcriptional regulator [Sulfitobacter mediterraneus]